MKPFSLEEYRGRHTLLTFFRFAGCIFCNMRVYNLILSYRAIQSAGVSVLTVFGSPIQSLRDQVGRQAPPFPLLAGPKDVIYDLYGVERSPFALVDPRNIPSFAQVPRITKYLGDPFSSEQTRLPADFLIGPDLRIERAHYGRYTSDHLAINEIVQWGSAGNARLLGK